MKKHIWISVILLLVCSGVLAGILLWRTREDEENIANVSSDAGNPSKDHTGEPETEWKDSDSTEKNTEIESADTTLIFAGDVLLWSHVREHYPTEGLDSFLSADLQEEFQHADIAMVNEEFPFGTRGTPMADKQYTFRVDPSYVTAFQELGIDLVSLANNHILDYGKEALLETFSTLDAAGIRYVGAGESRERAKEAQNFTVNGKKIGILSASRVIPTVDWNVDNSQPGVFTTYDGTALCEEIRQTKAECDFVAVFVHWGVEHQEYPEEYQRVLAREYIDAGADLVLGAHSHCLQGIEYYNGKPVFYGLGNFCFAPEIARTMAVRVKLGENSQAECTLLPAKAVSGCTRRMDEAEAEELYHYMEEISEGIAIDESGVLSQSGAE